jgi:hypothetical protein
MCIWARRSTSTRCLRSVRIVSEDASRFAPRRRNRTVCAAALRPTGGFRRTEWATRADGRGGYPVSLNRSNRFTFAYSIRLPWSLGQSECVTGHHRGAATHATRSSITPLVEFPKYATTRSSAPPVVMLARLSMRTYRNTKFVNSASILVAVAPHTCAPILVIPASPPRSQQCGFASTRLHATKPAPCPRRSIGKRPP